MRTESKSEARQFLEEVTGGPLTLGELLLAIRQGENLSQAEFARRLDVSRSHLCDLEKGRKTLSPRRAARFARILGYGEAQFVSLALQAMVEEAGLQLTVRRFTTLCGRLLGAQASCRLFGLQGRAPWRSRFFAPAGHVSGDVPQRQPRVETHRAGQIR